MKTGESVRVYPAGKPDRAAIGRIVIVSGNGKLIAVAFGESYVPFINGATGMAIHPEHGKMFFASRKDQGWYGWSDIFSSGDYEVELADADSSAV